MKKIPVISVLVVSFYSLLAQTTVPESIISNKLLNARIYLPDSKTGYYRGTRFDRSGLIASLEFKGHNFYGQWFEKYNPETHDAVMGPVEEFGPVGYNDVLKGGSFLKIGVGVLIRPDEKPYNNFRLYTIKNAGEWKIKNYPTGVKFIHTINDSIYSYRYEKQIQLITDSPEMIINHTLINKGKVPIITTVYNHNFPVIDKQPTGPAYSIIFSFKLYGTGQGFDDVIQIQDNKLVYLRDQTPRDRVYCGDFKGFGESPSDYDIKIENKIAGAGLWVRCDRPLYRLVYWSSPTTVCPEPYINIQIQPGEKFTWQLKYEYYVL